jgi:hypothetical protein
MRMRRIFGDAPVGRGAAPPESDDARKTAPAKKAQGFAAWRDEGISSTSMTAMTSPSSRFAAAGLAIASLAALAVPGAVAAAGCQAASGPRVPTVVELYTSEGCSSCPPADRWLGALKDRPDIVALAFHVDYWDSLGWKDRFGQAQFTQRQSGSMRTTGARFAYTPQVVIDGRDAPRWTMLAPGALAPKANPTVGLKLAQEAAALELIVTPAANAPARLNGYLAVVDDDLQTQVGGGENRGATLHHDGVVRELLNWTASAGAPQTLRFTPATTPEPGATRRWVAVALDETGKPLQALALACPR